MQQRTRENERMADGFKRLKERELLKSRVFTVRQEEWRGPDGHVFTRDTIVHPGAVAIVPIAADGKILLIKQFRPAIGSWLLEIPAGTLERGEKPLFCAKRELIEETGYAARNWKKLGEIFPAPGFCSEIIHLYCARDLTPAFAEKDEDEHIRLAAMSRKDVLKAVKSGKIRDAKTISALFFMK